MTYEEKKKQLNRIAPSIEIMVHRVKHQDEIAWLIEELEKAWAALEFYADEASYEMSNHDAYDAAIDDDKGKRAREALNE